MEPVQSALRDAYCEIFSGDIYTKFVEFFTPDAAKLTSAADRKKLRTAPVQGDLDPSVVKKSAYFFS